jgi:hypothetical protein
MVDGNTFPKGHVCVRLLCEGIHGGSVTVTMLKSCSIDARK